MVQEKTGLPWRSRAFIRFCMRMILWLSDQWSVVSDQWSADSDQFFSIAALSIVIDLSAQSVQKVQSKVVRCLPALKSLLKRC